VKLNLDQALSIVRWLLSLGGPLGAWLVAHGMSADQVNALSSALIALVGALPPLVSIIWSLARHSDAGKLKAASAMPEVKSIVVRPVAADSAAGALASDTSEPKIQRAA
jgi:hypothetical protein